MNKFVLIALVAIIGIALLAACDKESDVVQRNLTTAANQFELQRKVTFYNSIRDVIMLQVEGRCDVTNDGRRVSLICKVGPDEYKRHFMGLADNVMYMVEQIGAVKANAYHTRIMWRPQTIIPDIDVEGSVDALMDNGNQ